MGSPFHTYQPWHTPFFSVSFSFLFLFLVPQHTHLAFLCNFEAIYRWSLMNTWLPLRTWLYNTLTSSIVLLAIDLSINRHLVPPTHYIPPPACLLAQAHSHPNGSCSGAVSKRKVLSLSLDFLAQLLHSQGRRVDYDLIYSQLDICWGKWKRRPYLGTRSSLAWLLGCLFARYLSATETKTKTSFLWPRSLCFLSSSDSQLISPVSLNFRANKLKHIHLSIADWKG